MGTMADLLVLISICLLLLVITATSTSIFYLYRYAWLEPERIRRALRKQGIKGPAPSLLFGNIPDIKRIGLEEKGGKGKDDDRLQQQQEKKNHVVVQHDLLSTLFPHINLWRKEYGPVFFYSTGNMVMLYVEDLDLVKEIYQSTSPDLGKPTFVRRNQGALLGGGVLSANGTEWARQRKIVAPEFFIDKVKGMVGLMVESTVPLLDSWETKIKQEGGIADIGVDEELKAIKADVISRACFGSNYAKGETIFSNIRTLQQALAEQTPLIGIPGIRYLPIKSNRKIWRLTTEIKSLILKVVEERRNKLSEKGRDLLGALIEGAGDDQTVDDFLVDNCKNIYFAGHETTASVAKWVLVLLASNPDWQNRVRCEVAELCKGGVPAADMLSHMPLLTMVIQETLRLYPPGPIVIREALRDMKFGDLHIPKGTHLWIPRLLFHYDPKIWGPNAGKFDPGRFAHGVSAACKLPNFYNPFGVGPRTCLGQSFAMAELKVVLSLILSRFVVSLSPKYTHGVAYRLVLEPEYGVNLLISRM